MTKVINCYQANVAASRQPKKFKLKFLNLSLISLLIAVGVFHLMNISDLTVKGFVLKELKNEVNSLASEKLDSEEKINKLQSYYTLSSRTEKLNMIAISEIDYLSVPGAMVARK